MAISIDFLANASRFLRGTQDTEKALEDVGTSLDDVARDGEQANDRLGASFRQLAENVRRQDVGGQAGTSMRKGAKEANEAVETVKENTASNLKEVAASFDGTAQGLSDGFQGLAAEILEGFGPGGLIAGALVAGGIGILSTQLQNADAESETFRNDVAALAQTLIDAGSAQAKLSDNLETFATQADKGKVSLTDIRKQADELGVPFERLAQAYAQGGDALQNVLDKTNSLIAAEQQQNIDRRAQAGQTVTLLDLDSARSRSLGSQRDKIVALQKETKAAQQAEKDWISAGGDLLQQRSDALDSYAGSVQDALADAGKDWEQYKTKQGVNLKAYNDALDKSVEAIEDYQTNVKTATKSLSADALDYILSLGEDAAPLLQQYVDAPKALQKRTADNWDRLGRASASSYKSALEDGLPRTVKGPKVVWDTNIPSVVRDAQAYLDSQPLYFRTATRGGKPLYGG